mmetsp:Transcript_65023/g.167361  ORF Transcript_65023/g.167361 Transcript_65023/m.167361 type:complete len:239 (+) Transcript_65023:372-1088(+)
MGAAGTLLCSCSLQPVEVNKKNSRAGWAARRRCPATQRDATPGAECCAHCRRRRQAAAGRPSEPVVGRWANAAHVPALWQHASGRSAIVPVLPLLTHLCVRQRQRRTGRTGVIRPGKPLLVAWLQAAWKATSQLTSLDANSSTSRAAWPLKRFTGPQSAWKPWPQSWPRPPNCRCQAQQLDVSAPCGMSNARQRSVSNIISVASPVGMPPGPLLTHWFLRALPQMPVIGTHPFSCMET